MINTPPGRCVILVILAVALLSACSGVEEKRQAYRLSESIAPLKLPPHLSQPQGSQALVLPEVNKDALGDQPFDVSPPVTLPSGNESDYVSPNYDDAPSQTRPKQGHAH